VAEDEARTALKGKSMKHRPDTLEGIKELRILIEGEHISWARKSPQLKREMTIYPETLTPEQQQRLNQIEQELLDMAQKAEEETRTKTVLKGK
jgi:hypothetical protein